MPTDFMIGADPEFTCLRGREVVSAGGVSGLTQEFGADGNGVTFEIRPAPDKNPLVVVNNIRNIFINAVKNSPECGRYTWQAGSICQGYPMGGHVHFGHVQRSYSNLVCNLDNYLGLVSVLIEDRRQGRERRSRGGYGFVGDHRCQTWGVEYRALSSWLVSPYVAAAVLSLAKTVFWESLNNSKFPWKNVVGNDDFSSMNSEKLYKNFPVIWGDITKMELYQNFKPYIDILYFLVTNRLTWFPKGNQDMKASWGILTAPQLPPVKVPMSVIWARYVEYAGS